VRIERRTGEPYGQRFGLTTPAATYDVALPVLGAFQQRNAATAALALEQLSVSLRPSVEDFQRALSRLVLPGRMEFFPSHPSVIFDVAHNPDKMRNLVDAVLETFAERRFACIVAVSESKDAKAMLGELTRLPASFIFTSFDTAGRTAVKPARLASLADDLGVWGRALADPVEAFSIARRSAAGDEIVLVTGSTFIVATLRDWWFANVAASAR